MHWCDCHLHWSEVVIKQLFFLIDITFFYLSVCAAIRVLSMWFPMVLAIIILVISATFS